MICYDKKNIFRIAQFLLCVGFIISSKGCKQVNTESDMRDSIAYVDVYTDSASLAEPILDSLKTGLDFMEYEDHEKKMSQEITTIRLDEKIIGTDFDPLKESKSSIKGLPRRLFYHLNEIERNLKEQSSQDIELVLLDSVDKETVAHKNLVIGIQINYLLNKQTEFDSVVFKMGEHSVIYKMKIKNDGPIQVVFNHRELTGTEILFRSMSYKKTGLLFKNNSVFQLVTFQQLATVLVIPPSSNFFYRANGKQEAIISYMIDDTENSLENDAIARINVVAPVGLLSANFIELNKESLATISVRSNRPGIITLRNVAVTQGLNVDPKEVQVTFVKDIDSFVIETPDSLHLMEEGYLIIKLKDTEGKSITTDRDLEYSISVDGGTLSLEPITGTIKTGKGEARIKIIPISIGQSKVKVSIENFLDKESVANILFPTFLIFLSVFAGIIGGGLSLFFNNREKTIWKVILAAITGPMLMWAAISLGLGNLSPRLVINPISCFIIAFLGGWAGVAVINLLLRYFGLAQNPPTSPAGNGN